jgi:hypothetical protein
MADLCAKCRFWLPDPESGEWDNSFTSFGTCRRLPPVISDHLAKIAMGAPCFGQQFDAEELATTNNVHSASLHPATFCTDWCGDYSPIPSARPVEV